MKVFIALFSLVLCTFAYAEEVKLISQETMVEYDGKYHYHYELGDGSKATQDGVLKHVDADHDGEAIEGKFAYISDDGKEYVVSYTADENGYRPVGAHLPTPPPIPESVLKTLKYLEEHPYHPPENKKH
ncbi:endocuticle structural glycoprotein SgAbd-3 [Teleopsis dalmanni]|uniref:endocuticle structural glycoprotein SgAbd-3 n=1 Tax=Teleopsis dalmanni TaxID=139649 RepID=UPI0018CCD188|nr:endocuticle structural glycoprotein SgAbd-3 [Teleopsis dalmanni]